MFLTLIFGRYMMLSKHYEASGNFDKAVEFSAKNVELAMVMGGTCGNGVKDADDRWMSLCQRQDAMDIS